MLASNGVLGLGTEASAATGFKKSNSPSKQLQVSTLNLKWFGIGGFMWNTPEQEYRQEYIKSFLEQELNNSDVIVFTEVVKTDVLKKIVADKMDCATYVGAWSRHQHVMICYDKYKLRAEKYDGDYIIENVDLGSGGLRPAAQAKICSKNGSCFLQVIGVHLAAGLKSQKRLEQVKLINEELARQSKMLPTIVTGDFNSYIKEQSGEDDDDIILFENALSKGTRRFRSVTGHITTYGVGEYAKVFDHIVTTNDIKVIDTWGYEACKQKPNFSKTFIPYGSYRKYFTDHCPVTAKVSIQY